MSAKKPAAKKSAKPRAPKRAAPAPVDYEHTGKSKGGGYAVEPAPADAADSEGGEQ